MRRGEAGSLGLGDTMRTTISFVVCLAAVSAWMEIAEAQTQQPQPATPIPGVSDDTMAKSARVSKLIGSNVYSADTSIGHIEDVLIDQTTVTAVILSVGGFLGIGDKLVAAPITAIRVGPEARFRTDLTKEQLTNAPPLISVS